MDSMVELAKRAEVLGSPDREVDLAVHCTLIGKAFRWSVFGGAYPDQKEIAVEVLPERLETDPFWFQKAEIIRVPAYTSSLDAAMSIVPEGWFWMAGNRDRLTPRAYIENGKSAYIGIGSTPNPERRWFETTAPTPALALTIAALYCRASIDAAGLEGGG